VNDGARAEVDAGPATEPAGGPPGRAVRGALLTDYFLAHLGFFALLAVLEGFTATQSGASSYAVGLALFAYNAAVGISCLLVSRWLPRFTYRAVMGCCLLLSAGALVVLPATRSVVVIILLLLVAGFGTSTHGLLGMSLIAQTTPGDAPRNRMYSLIQITVNVSASLGPALAIFLYGLHSRLPLFLTISVCYLAASAVIFTRLPGRIRPGAPDTGQPAGAAGPRRVLADPAVLRTVLMTLLGCVLYAQLFSAFALVVLRDLTGFLHSWIFTLNALLIVVLQAPVSAMLGRFLRGRSPALFLNLGALLFCAAFLIFGSSLPVGVATLAGIAVFSFGETVFTPLVSTAFARLENGSLLASFNLRQVFTTLGMMLGSFAGGSLFLVASASGNARTYWNVLALVSIASIVLIGLIGVRRRHGAEKG
jgi:MFS transporter, DHA1 family, multidrug resistance protein